VFRGFLEDPKGDPSSTLWFVGDLRTEKAEQVDVKRAVMPPALPLALTLPSHRCSIPTEASSYGRSP
jgi:hypothetical protein